MKGIGFYWLLLLKLLALMPIDLFTDAQRLGIIFAAHQPRVEGVKGPAREERPQLKENLKGSTPVTRSHWDLSKE